MACHATPACSELDFVRQVVARVAGECKGPVVPLARWVAEVMTLERIFNNGGASDVLWGGFEREDHEVLYFALCAAHWLDLACLTWALGCQRSRPDWLYLADELLQDLCHATLWDSKEIANMFAWQALG